MIQYLTPVIRFCEGESVDLLVRALRSLLIVNKSIINVVIVHTNGSEPSILKEVLPFYLYNKIDYTSIQSTNDSRSSAIIESRKKIKGEHILFLDYDDELDSRAMEVIDDYQMVSQFKLVFGNYSYLYFQNMRNKNILKDIFSPNFERLERKSYCLANHSPMGSFLIAKDLFIRVNIVESLVYQEDYYLLLSALLLITDHEIMSTSTHFLRCWRDMSISHAEKYASDNSHSMYYINQKRMELLFEK